MAFKKMTNHSIALSTLLFLSATACSSDGGQEVMDDPSDLSDEQQGDEGTESSDESGDEDAEDGPSETEDEPSETDAAPGALTEVKVAAGDKGVELSWNLPEDEDLSDLLLLVLPSDEAVPSLEDAMSVGLTNQEMWLGDVQGTSDYVAYFFLVDEAGNVTTSDHSFTTGDLTPPAELSDTFALGLNGAVYVRYVPPESDFFQAVVRTARGDAPMFADEGAPAYEGDETRLILDQYSNEAWGFFMAAADESGNTSVGATHETITGPDYFQMIDAEADCGSFESTIGDGIGQWQTFTRGAIGEDVLSGIELKLKRTGEPTEKVQVTLRTALAELLWQVEIPAEKIPTVSTWIALNADGKGDVEVPYVILDEGTRYRIEVNVPGGYENEAEDYFTWRTSPAQTPDSICYEAGRSKISEVRDFSFRTKHAAFVIQ